MESSNETIEESGPVSVLEVPKLELPDTEQEARQLLVLTGGHPPLVKSRMRLAQRSDGSYEEVLNLERQLGAFQGVNGERVTQDRRKLADRLLALLGAR